ncbi:DedA family protein [Vibrio sp. Isolate31]|uniref:DedA family protein n=1 Tax=unclassified Vibrio TaxID=2614977 RepID=UPI001EFDAC14|nr:MULTISPECIES: DedA family protein [unclassified Vibrio]MCG9555703.1 DedA family protein [Vibrio sp. Isolate32]MCG9601359.1 DedA family protein [Vibrio sp. Isolate31]
MQHINDLLVTMKPLLDQYGDLALIVSLILEGVGLPMPGLSLMIAALVMSSQKMSNLTFIIFVSWLSCFIGNTFGYLLGYYFESWLGKKGYVSGPRMQHLQAIIKRYGPICLIISRFVEGMKQFMPLACGIAKMSRRDFLIGNASATSIWVAVYGMLTYLFVEYLHRIEQFYRGHRLVIWVIAAILFLLLVVALLKRRSRIN